MENLTPIHIAIADDHTSFRNGMALLLSTQKDFILDFDAKNGKEFLDKIAKAKNIPDVCMLDIRMPIMDGYDTLQELLKQWPTIRILILSSHDHEHTIISMLRSGASGYLLKDADEEDIFKAIRQIHTKGHYHSDIVEDYFHKMNTLPSLSQREKEFLVLCCQELTYKEIADRMNISSRTVESYRDKLFHKLQVVSRSGLVVFALKTGIA